jgi:RNA polymerase sigma factor (sigma-70 family)
MDKVPESSKRFATTHWSLVQAACGPASREAQKALATLCEAYWYPLYAFVRRRGKDPEEARDLTQAFFATLLEKGYLQDADQQRGRFRTFLMAACGHFLSKEKDRSRTIKRGGGRLAISLDFEDGEHRYLLEPAHSMTAERLFDRRWALTLLDRVINMLGDEYAQAGKTPLYERLKVALTGESDGMSYVQVAADLGMTEGAIKVAAHRLRKRFRSLLREEIGKTVATPDEIDDEIKLLFEKMRGD